MWLPSQQSTLTELFQTALIKLCSENIPFEGHLELDGLVCISNGDVSRQIVVKIHKVIESKMQKLSANVIPVGRSLLKPYNELFGGSNPAGLTNASTPNIPSRSLLSSAADQKKTFTSERFAWMGGKDLSKQSGSGMSTVTCINGLGRQDNKPELSNAHSNYPIRVLTMETLPNKGSLEYIHEASDQGDKAICLVNRSPASTEKRLTGAGDATITGSHFLQPSPVNSRNNSLPVKSLNDVSILKLLNVEPSKTANTEIVFASDLTFRKRANSEAENVELRVKKECLNDGIGAGGLVETNISAEDSPGAPTSCRLCNVPCTGRSLEIHMRYVHKRFLCKICFNAFTLSCNLRRHMKLHAGVRPHACEHCDSSFSRSTDLRIHMRKHGVFESPDSGRNRGNSSGDSVQRQCHLCPKVFTGLSSLNRHLYRTHNTKSSSNRACHICEKVFDSPSSLMNHQRTHESSLAEHGGSGQRQLDFDEHHEVDDGETDEEFENDEDGGGDEDVIIGGEIGQLKPSFKKCESLDNLTENNNNKCDNNNEDNYTEIKCDVSPLCLVQDGRVGGSSSAGNDKDLLSKKDLTQIVVDAKYSETMRDFAPLFNIAGDDGDNKGLDSIIINKLESTPSSSSVASGSTATGISSAPVSSGSRSKRKGQPMKHVDSLINDDLVVKDDTLEMSATSMSLTIPSASSKAAGEETSKNESTDDLDADRLRNRTASPGEDDLEQKVFTCRHGGCATSWYGYIAYENHYSTAHYRFPCTMCDQSFTSRNNRRRHAASHTDGKRHPCETCGKLFARPDIVKEHRLTHTKSYQSGKCCVCGVACEKKVLLLSHLKKCFRTTDDIDEDIPKSEIMVLSTKTTDEQKTIDGSV